MKSLLKKLHIKASSSDDTECSTSSKGGKPTGGLLPDKIFQSQSRHSATPTTSSTVAGVEGMEPVEPVEPVSSHGLDVVCSSTNSRENYIREEYQIQLAMAMSAKEDPEAVQIEAVKQISLDSCPSRNTPAEVVAFRYWSYNALSYDDKILDGFYDLYGITSKSTSERMPSLVDLQRAPLSDSASWEAILVDHTVDPNLLKLEQEALVLATNSRSDLQDFVSADLVRKLAIFVAEYMGGSVRDLNNMSRSWRSLSYSLRSTLWRLVLPIGSLTIGLARHRSLLFKVLADALGIPCSLVKGQQHTGFDGMAINFVKIDDGREYIVDLMAHPGMLIPSDASGLQLDHRGSLFSATPSLKNAETSHVTLLGNCLDNIIEDHPRVGTQRTDNESGDSNLSRPIVTEEQSKVISNDHRSFPDVDKAAVHGFPIKPIQSRIRVKSPSWTEGDGSPTAQKLKVKDVSQCMMDAAKLSPQLAQKLDNVLLESGVVAPPNLFTEFYSEQSVVASVSQSPDQDKKGFKGVKETQNKMANYSSHLKQIKSVGGSGTDQEPRGLSVECNKNAPGVAAAAAAAAVVASSMVAVVAKSSTDSNVKHPAASAATAMAAAMAAATTAISKQYDQTETGAELPNDASALFNPTDCIQDDLLVDGNGLGVKPEAGRASGNSTGNDAAKSDVAPNDAADCEVAWDDVTLGERIRLGSFGEVYHGELHGTEVAVKKFLTQDISKESLEEFKSEVLLMKKLRHPNLVLFMGAVTRAPNLSIVTEFLPRGNLYRLIHRPNNQLDERRCLRMALDTARGMNYLHNCTPIFVHRDLKSPNLLVDKNWVVKVSGFGLSRMKHGTFLSSRSSAGTAEWMAPEILRNEPSDEKCDVYSFGVVLWELSTLQQPWDGMNQMQVVRAVGFEHRRLHVPDNIHPAVASIIHKCWQADPKLRPSFAEIMAALRPLQKARV